METISPSKTYLVTGATSGIGREIATLLAARGTTVIGIGRSAERCRDAETALCAVHPSSRVRYLTADLSLQCEVRRLAVDVSATLRSMGIEHIDGLANNAGTFTYWFTQTAEGFETQWAVNHLAPFLLTHQLLPLLQRAPSARVVTVTSDSHYAGRIHWEDVQLRRRYNGLQAYEQSKLANVLFSAEFNRILPEGSRLRAYAADPGLVKTDIGLKGTPSIVRWIWNLRRSAGISPHESALGIVYLLTSPEVDAHRDQVYWKHTKPVQPSRRSRDVNEARKLWNLSAGMCAL